MFKFLKRSSAINIEADIHSHLLPGLDDGVRSVEESLQILKFFESLGYKKVITTPHINPELFENTEEKIFAGLEAMQKAMHEAGLKIKLDAAAEYYIGKELLDALDQHQRLLSFGSAFVLIETSFYSKPIIFEEVVFKLKTNGYIPVLAHPERYQYLNEDIAWLKEIKQMDVKLQVTLSSLVGMYGKGPQKLAEKLLKHEMVDFLGSDIHRENQVDLLAKALQKRITPQTLLNNELI